MVYRGADAAENLLENLQKEAEEIIESLEYRERAIKTPEVRREYNKATICHICEEPLDDCKVRDHDHITGLYRGAAHNKCKLKYPKRDIIDAKEWEEYKEATICHICKEPLNGYKVLDHDHITGLYRGAAHNECNLKLRINKYKLKIPVMFHNLRGYDSHLLMQAIGKVSGNITCIPNNTEKYISFSIGNLRFIDSAQFLIASLDKLVSFTPPEAFKITSVNESDASKKELLIRKGVYPYEYMDSWKRFDEESLPPIESFYSKLTGTSISE